MKEWWETYFGAALKLNHCSVSQPIALVTGSFIFQISFIRYPPFLPQQTNKTSINVRQWGQFDKRCTLPIDLSIKRSNVSGDELLPWSWHNFCTITYTCRLTIYIQCTFVFITNTFQSTKKKRITKNQH